jgi:thiamine-phosphate pyrophosphorylase
MLDLTSAVVGLAHRAGALVVVNDRADIARLAGADGVHVGQEDLPPSAVRPIVGPGGVVGLSTHTPEQIDRAVLEPVDYIAVGPVFETGTKATGYAAVGLDRVRYAARQARARGLPLVAIGGITLEMAPLVLDAGAQSVAVITDLLVGGDPASRVKQFVAALAPHAG